jgi:hypothetical protein
MGAACAEDHRGDRHRTVATGRGRRIGAVATNGRPRRRVAGAPTRGGLAAHALDGRSASPPRVTNRRRPALAMGRWWGAARGRRLAAVAPSLLPMPAVSRAPLVDAAVVLR